jgi:2-isopropylmalate synthase
MTSKQRLYLFDTTLRDGQNAFTCSTPHCATASRRPASISRSRTRSRLRACSTNLAFDYVEGGYPGANPTDRRFFSKQKRTENATFVAFGMTKRRAVFQRPTIPA